MFAGIEIAARRSCAAMTPRSERGNCRVVRSTTTTVSRARCHTLSCRRSCTQEKVRLSPTRDAPLSRMGQPISVSGWRGRRTSVRFQNRDACLDALVTDIHGRTSHKPLDLVAGSAAEGAAQSRSRAQPVRQPPELRHPSHILYPRFARAKQPVRVFRHSTCGNRDGGARTPGNGPTLVSRFRSSPHCAARSLANFGIEGH